MKKRTLAKAVAVAAVLALGGFLFAWSGLFNIGASTGHWAITAWFLHFAMRNSVETHSLGIEPPPSLDDAALILKGAGHFAQGCAPCHGTPGDPRNPVVLEMTPHPPELKDRIGRWQPEELFWIVKHGVKFTGMPAWPAPQREDEVWAVAAFLLRLPELSPAEYRRLTEGEVEGGRAGEAERDADQEAALVDLDDPLGPALANCARCHGRDGRGRGEAAFPILTGQKPAYLQASLHSYAQGARSSGIMQLAASGLDEETVAALARHYAFVADDGGTQALGLERPAGVRPAAPATADAALRHAGQSIAEEGVPGEGVPPCASCHGPTATPRHPIYPVLAGQHVGYLGQQLRLFKEGVRGGTPYAHIMATIARRMTERQIEAVSLYYATLGTAADSAASAADKPR